MSLEPSLVALFIQTAGIALVAILSYLVNRSIGRTPLYYWNGAWASLSVGLAALLVASTIPGTRRFLEPVYLLGEYVFGYLLVAGCHNYATGWVIDRRHAWALIPAGALAVALPALSGYNINVFFVPQAAILATFFVAAFIALRPARGPAQGQGLGTMRLALALLAIAYAHYVPMFTLESVGRLSLPLGYLQYSSLYDLILHVLLSFGIVMLVTESVRAELGEAHREAAEARDRLEVLARMDPMTESLNRHALYALLDRGGRLAHAHGSVALVDVDDLKRINDTHGHMAGDVAIRHTAKAIRSFVRPDDLVFRWGGDEFLVLLFGVSEKEARRRFDMLNGQLGEVVTPGTGQPLRFTVSVGLASIDGASTLDAVIERADAAMYGRKRTRSRAILAS